jgi:hypothetical protein
LYGDAAGQTADDDIRQAAKRGMADAKESLGDLELQLRLEQQAAVDLADAEKLYTDVGMPAKAEVIRQTLASMQAAEGVTHG